MILTGNRLADAMAGLAEVKLLADVEQIASHLGVTAFLNYVKERNPSKDLPYHNNLHQFQVAVTAYRLYTLGYHANEGYFEIGEVTDLFLAALFHDYDHTGGKEADNLNITYACQGFLNAHHELPSGGLGADVNFYSMLGVVSLIKATEFPWKDEHFHPLEAVIRDADILASAEIAGFSLPITGLPVELQHKLGKVLTPEEMVDGQHKFMTTLQLHTEAGKLMWQKLYPHILDAQKAFAAEMNRTLTR